jgi:hypothetical protein
VTSSSSSGIACCADACGARRLPAIDAGSADSVSGSSYTRHSMTSAGRAPAARLGPVARASSAASARRLLSSSCSNWSFMPRSP